MTGPASILEGKAGIFSAFARAPELAARMESQLADLGERWAVTEARPKAAPCCHYILAFIEALEEVLGQGVAPAQIRAIRCTVDPRQAQLICEPWAQKLAPPSGYAAKWSLPFCLAARALRGPVSVALFERPLEAEVLAFARRIEWTPKEDGFPDRYPGRLSVALADGGTLESYVPDVLGGADRPFPEAQLIAKFRAATGAVLPASEVAGLLREVQALEQADDQGAGCVPARRATAHCHRRKGSRPGCAMSVELIAERVGLDYARDGNATVAIQDFSLRMTESEFITVVAPAAAANPAS